MKPRIAIPLPTSFDAEYNRLNCSAYTDAVRQSGGVPVDIALDLGKADLNRVARSCDGFLLPGSPADLEPTTYGQARDEASAPADAKRETVDRLLLTEAWSHDKPVLGICFGAQILNVFRGGTLVQDLLVQPVNHAAGRAVCVAHTAAVAPHSLLAKVIDPAETTLVDDFLRLPVNSSHHQAIGVVAPGLRLSARCPQDGVVEAIESPNDGTFVLGVQWHPERTYQVSASSRSMFDNFIRACVERTATANTTVVARS